jgi:ribosomal protein S18 acetylase RimI-like enzyme
MSTGFKLRVLGAIKLLLKPLVGEYSAYLVYRSPDQDEPVLAQFTVRALQASDLDSSTDEVVRRQTSYLGPQSLGFVCMEGEQALGLCFYWFGERYRKRNFWPLQEDEAKLVQIVTVARAQGRGVATTLIRQSLARVRQAGFRCAFARVWHSNVGSYKAFERAGWRRIAFVAEIHPLGRAAPWRFVRHFPQG